MSAWKRLEPLSTVSLIREIDEALEKLLARLDDDAWGRPAVKDWRVRDVAAHLLDTNLRRLSLDRDRHRPDGMEPPGDPGSFRSWVDFLNRLNADWTRAAERLSPSVILGLLRITNPQVSDYFDGLDPEAPATFSVLWARPSESKVWLDVAREYTEKWHHQHQIRDAVGQPGLSAPHLVRPLIETLLRAVPPVYDGTPAEMGASVLIQATDLDGGRWLCYKDGRQWNLYEAPGDAEAHATIRMTAETMWKLLMKQTSRDHARGTSEMTGATELVAPFFEAVAVMA